MSPDSQLVSFVLRFVCEAPAAGQPAERWRGMVRHVQSDDEQHFVRWADAVLFMEQYVRLQQGEDQEL